MSGRESAARLGLDAAARRHQPYLRARLASLGVPEARLDDAAQDVLEVLARRLDDYDDRYSFRQWMSGVARKVARRHREQAARAPVPLSQEPVDDVTPGPEAWVRRREAHAVLEQFLGRLDRDRWAVFVLSELEGLRGTEIAAELDVNLSTVYARLRAARADLERTVARRRARERRFALLGGLNLLREAPLATLAFTSIKTLLWLTGLAALVAAAILYLSKETSDPSPDAPTTAAPPRRLAEVTPRALDPAGLAVPQPAPEQPRPPPIVTPQPPRLATPVQNEAIRLYHALYEQWTDDAYEASFALQGEPWRLHEQLEWFHTKVGPCGPPELLVAPNDRVARYVLRCEQGEIEAALTLVDADTPRMEGILHGVRGVAPDPPLRKAAEEALAFYHHYDDARVHEVFTESFDPIDLEAFLEGARARWGPCTLDGTDLVNARGALFDLDCERGPRLMKIELAADDRIKNFRLQGRRKSSVREG